MTRKLSEFLYRGADVMVEGREETIMTLEKRNRGPNKGLTLHFVSGNSVKYDERKVKPIPGRIDPRPAETKQAIAVREQPLQFRPPGQS